MAALLGRDFTPLGGKKDGSADGAVQAGLFEGKPSHFMQASIQDTFEVRFARPETGRCVAGHSVPRG
jgi:hypothetical protein